jgi:hypothetical protein
MSVETPLEHETALKRAAAPGMCQDCSSFDASPAVLERTFPGLASMGSGFSAVRWNDGLCAVHDRYLTCSSSCGRFSPRPQLA